MGMKYSYTCVWSTVLRVILQMAVAPWPCSSFRRLCGQGSPHLAHVCTCTCTVVDEDARVMLDMPYGALASWPWGDSDLGAMPQAPRQHLLVLWRGKLEFMVA